MHTELNRFRHAITSNPHIAPQDDALLIERQGTLACHYAPFEHINPSAQVALLGMTPGAQQAGNALRALCDALVAGMTDADALATAKTTASFSGTMRGNLVAMLDHVGLHHRLGLVSCAELFTTRTDLVHYTSALRYPVFLDGKDYSGTPGILHTPFLKAMSERWLTEEVLLLQDAYWIPLGKQAKIAIEHQVARGRLNGDRILDGMPHPSGANAERIAYFLGRKARTALSAKTDADLLDISLATLRGRIAGQLTPEYHSPIQAPTRLSTPTIEVEKKAKPLHVKASSAPKHAASSASVVQAESIIMSRLERIKPGNKKVAGFETKLGRHLAIQRDVERINIWTEDVDPPCHIGDFERYPANRSRHSNLASQAPRVSNGHHARLWRLECASQLETLIAWYSHA